MMEKIRMFEMFSGYGGASFGLKMAGVPFECVGFSEINKYAIDCYIKNHGNIKNYGDCKKINPSSLPDFDILTGGFPCQDVSHAGKRDLSKGRSLLVNDIFRIIKEKKPRYLVLENVYGLLTMKNFWRDIRYTLRELGYDIRYKTINSNDHGIPQLRPRVWIVCKYGKWGLFEFMFPESIPLDKFLGDILEGDVDKKYYHKQDKCKKRRGYEMPRPRNRINILYKTSKNKWNSANNAYDINGICATLICTEANNISINKPFRKLTPKECFRLMGFLNDEIDLSGIQERQQYILAGNGWDVNVAKKIFRNLFKNEMRQEKKLYNVTD